MTASVTDSNPTASIPDVAAKIGPWADLEERFRKAAAPESARVKCEEIVQRILHRFERCFVPGATEVVFPRRDEFDQLDEAIQNLSKCLSKRPPKVLLDCYRRVNTKKQKFRLMRRLKTLAKRGALIFRARPMGVFYGYQTERGVDQRLAAEFIGVWRSYLREPNPKAVEWRRFTLLFERFRKSRMGQLQTKLGGGKAGDPDLIAYTVFLEIFCEDQTWLKVHGESVYALTRWVERLCDPEMARSFGPWLEDAEQIDHERRTEAKRAVAARRQMKFRAKKKASKSVTG